MLDKLKTDADRIAQIQMAHEKFAIVGDGTNATCAGNLKTGCAINFKCPQQAAAETGGIINTPPPATGACCFSDGSCEAESAGDCASDGGSYQGDGTSCDPNPCDLCSSPITLCKCGFSCDNIHFYLTNNTHDVFEDEYDQTFEGDTVVHCHTTGDVSYVDTYTVNEDGTCSFENIDCSGSIHTVSLNIDGCGPIDSTCTFSFPDDCGCGNCFDYGRCTVGASGQGITHETTCEDGVQTDTYTIDFLQGVDPAPVDHFFGSNTITQTFSDEYTTDMLIANTLALLACGEVCHALYTLNEDETCCTAWCVTDV